MCKRYFLLILLVSLSVAAHAQLFKRYHAHDDQTPPKAILVRLATAASRIDYYAKKGNAKNVQLLQADAAAQREHMVADFKAHFTYCPVYYFYDTAQAAIKAKDFSYLLDGDMKPATNLVIGPADSNYYIVYFGYVEEPKTLKNDPIEYSSGSTNTTVKTLAALNPDFTPLPRNLPYKAWPVSTIMNRKKDVNVARYEFQSEKFDLSYEPYAGLYSHNLTTFYRHK